MSIVLRPKGRMLAIAFACVATLAGGVFSWLKASDHRDSALLTSDRAAETAVGSGTPSHHHADASQLPLCTRLFS